MAVGEDTVARLANDAHVVPWTARLHAPSASALYVHLPFCVRKCAYCDFASWETPRGVEAMSRYVDALCSQLKEARDAGLLDACETAYVGGGTPTLLGRRLAALTSGAAEAIASGGGGLLDRMRRRFNERRAEDVTEVYRPDGYDYRSRRKEEDDEVDRILEKLKKSGYESLTEEEKQKLFDRSNRDEQAH